MPKAQRTIVIDRPADEVFAFFADPGNDLKWRPHVKEIAAQGPAGLGSTIHQVVMGPGGRGIPADMKVVAYEPSTRYAFQVTAGPARPSGEFLFAESGSGTEVSFSMNAELSGIKKIALSKPVQRSMDGQMASLDTAKRIWRQDRSCAAFGLEMSPFKQPGPVVCRLWSGDVPDRVLGRVVCRVWSGDVPDEAPGPVVCRLGVETSPIE